MNVYIPNINFNHLNKKHLFILARPFLGIDKWVNNDGEKINWCINNINFNYESHIEQAQIVFIPFPINYYYKNNLVAELKNLNSQCVLNNIIGYAYISGDFGKKFPEYSNITYFRMGGFKSQLSNKNKGFPASLSDHFQRLFNQKTITPITKPEIPVIGFCGHASTSLAKYIKEILIFGKENTKRFFQNPLRKDWELFFASASQRAKLLKSFENSNLVKTNFIYRNQYRGGIQTDENREKTTLEYYNNISQSNYVLCVRGAGNFSVRLYETLMMGKIPVFVNTDCILPFEDKINWKNHVVWVEWKDRKKIAAMVSDFHKQLSDEDFINIQLNNRKLWKETLSVGGMLKMIADDI